MHNSDAGGRTKALKTEAKIWIATPMLLLMVAIPTSLGQIFLPGRCPRVPPIKNFNIRRVRKQNRPPRGRSWLRFLKTTCKRTFCQLFQRPTFEIVVQLLIFRLHGAMRIGFLHRFSHFIRSFRTPQKRLYFYFDVVHLEDYIFNRRLCIGGEAFRQGSIVSMS